MAKQPPDTRIQPSPGLPQPPAPMAPIQPTPAQPAAPVPDEKARAKELIGKIEQLRGSRVIVYWMSSWARISEAVVPSLYDQLRAIGKQDRIDLILYTTGGDTEAPWRIVSLIREYCKRFGVLVPHRAHSAGTLIAMGADEIVMTSFSELGPIDPSRTHPLLPRREGEEESERISVQDMRHAMQFIRDAAGAQVPYTPEAMAQIFTALFDKIHPLAIGAIEQSYALSKLVGTQCLFTHMDRKAEADKVKTIVDKLCDDYKSHAYKINRVEATALGLKVVNASDDIETALVDLLKFYLSRNLGVPKPPTPGQKFKAFIAWLDSLAMQLRVAGNYEAQKDGQIKALGDEWVAY